MVIMGGISHDLRTYAARLRLRAELIADEQERAKVVRDLDEMNRLLDDFLMALDASPREREQELFEVVPLLEREVEDRRLAGAPVSLSVSSLAETTQMLGHPLAIRRLVANLTDNAIAYGHQAIITATLDNDELIITVDDKGPGIAPDDRMRVFEPFMRLRSVT